MKPNGKNIRAFTLIELSIVMVIIALIVGGILKAGSLQDASQIQAVIKQVQGHITTATLFQERYSTLPGDMIDAESIWGGSLTDNGNGDGQVSGETTEEPHYWQHLFLAELMQQSYTGDSAGTPTQQIGVNMPDSALDQGGFRVVFNSDVHGLSSNFVTLAAQSSATALTSPAISPIDAAAIDEKIDDRFSDSGNVRATGANCLSGTSYDLTEDAIACVMYFDLDGQYK